MLALERRQHTIGATKNSYATKEPPFSRQVSPPTRNARKITDPLNLRSWVSRHMRWPASLSPQRQELAASAIIELYTDTPERSRVGLVATIPATLARVGARDLPLLDRCRWRIQPPSYCCG